MAKKLCSFWAGLLPELCGVPASVRPIGSGPGKARDPKVDIGFNEENQVIGPEKMVLCDDLKV